MQRRVISEVLQQAQIVIEAAALEHDAQLLQGRRRVPPHVVAQNADLAADIIVEPGDKSKQRRLAGPVRPQQHDKGAARHGERDIGERPARPKLWLTPRTCSAFTDCFDRDRATGVVISQ